MTTERPAAPWVVAHRGASAGYPENTPIAFDAALDQGSDAIELDVQLSRDDVPVVYHDRTLARAGGGRRRVSQLDLGELSRLDAGAWLDNRFRGQHIASLDEILETYGRRTRLLIEIKAREGWFGRARHARLARAVCARVREMELEDRVMVLCFDPRVLHVCARTVPGIRRVLNLTPPAALGRRLRRLLDGLYALSADIRSLTPGFGMQVRDADRALMTYTCNTEPEVDLALRCGASAIMSDRPDWLAEALTIRGVR